MKTRLRILRPPGALPGFRAVQRKAGEWKVYAEDGAEYLGTLFQGHAGRWKLLEDAGPGGREWRTHWDALEELADEERQREQLRQEDEQ